MKDATGILSDSDFMEVGAEAAQLIMRGVDKFEHGLGGEMDREKMSDLMTYTNAVVAHTALSCILTMMTKGGVSPKEYDNFCRTFIDVGIAAYCRAQKENSVGSLDFMDNLIGAAVTAGLDEEDLNSPEIREIIAQKAKQEASKRNNNAKP